MKYSNMMNERMAQFYMNLAEECSKMSRAIRLQVGAVIVKNNNIISFSWNGTPSGWDNCCEYEVPEHIDPDTRTITPAHLVTKPEVMHAERNAIDKLARSQESGYGATIFITHAPCVECAKSIYMSGIQSVYYRNDYRSNDGIKFLEKCGLPVTKI